MLRDPHPPDAPPVQDVGDNIERLQTEKLPAATAALREANIALETCRMRGGSEDSPRTRRRRTRKQKHR
jgi:hypothetical protein